jgi:hypothetical protein
MLLKIAQHDLVANKQGYYFGLSLRTGICKIDGLYPLYAWLATDKKVHKNMEEGNTQKFVKFSVNFSNGKLLLIITIIATTT